MYLIKQKQKEKGEIYMTQQSVRERYIKRIEREKQIYIANVTGIPTSVLTQFKQGKKELFQESLQTLNDYLDGKLEQD